MSDTAKRLEVLYDLQRYEELLHVSIPLCASNTEDKGIAYHYTILALINLERLDEALEVIKKALAQFPSEVHFLYFQTFVFFKQDRLREADSLAQSLLAQEPNHAVYHHVYAKILLEQERYVEAKRAIDKTLVLDPHDTDFLATLAHITYSLGNTPIACDIISAILGKEPHHGEALRLQSHICTSLLMQKANIFQGMLLRNPFDKEGAKQLESIKRYYQIAPALMLTFLLYALGEYLEMWEKSSHTSGVLFLLSLYVWRDWRLSLPFFAVSFILLGSVEWHEWYVIPLGTGMYYMMGRVGGELLRLLFAKIEEMFHKGKRWMNR